MAISFISGSGYVAGTTSLSIPYPVGIESGDLIILFVTNKYPANGPSTPSGFTAPANNQYTGGAGAAGGDSGEVYITAFTRIADGTETGNLAVTITSANCSIGAMALFRKASDMDWDIACAGGSDNSVGTAWSVTAGADPGIQAGDYIATESSINTDSYSFSSVALTATGVTFGSPLFDQDTTNSGDDCGTTSSLHSVDSGTSSAAPVYTMTADGSDANSPAGATILVRMREVEPGGGAISGTTSGAAAVTGILSASGALQGAIAGIGTAAATLLAAGAMAAASAGTSSATGVLAGTGDIAAQVAGTSSATGTLMSSGELAGAIAGTSSANATAFATGLLSGNSAGTSQANGAIQATGELQGAAAGTSTVTGSLVQGAMSGSASGSSTAQGTLNGTGELTGTIAGSSTTTGLLSSGGAIQGAAAGSAQVTGTMQATGQLIGSAAGTSTATLQSAEQAVIPVNLKSKITIEINLDSEIATELNFKSQIETQILLISKI